MVDQTVSKEFSQAVVIQNVLYQ